MASQTINTMLCFSNKTVVAEFVEEMLPYLETFSASTMIIRQAGSGDYYVSFAIVTSLESIEILSSLRQLLNTYSLKQNYMSQREREERGERNDLETR